MQINLTEAQVEALKEKLEIILSQANYGFGVDLWIGDPKNENLLLDVDEPANEALTELLGTLTDTSPEELFEKWHDAALHVDKRTYIE